MRPIAADCGRLRLIATAPGGTQTLTTAPAHVFSPQVEERLRFYDTGEAPRKNLDVMREVIEELRAESGGAPAKKEKKEEKKEKKEDKKGNAAAPVADDDVAAKDEDVAAKAAKLAKKAAKLAAAGDEEGAAKAA